MLADCHGTRFISYAGIKCGVPTCLRRFAAATALPVTAAGNWRCGRGTRGNKLNIHVSVSDVADDVGEKV